MSASAMSPFLVLHLPHSSQLIPADERRQLIPCDADLNAELLWMTDAFTDELFLPTAQEAARIVFPVSRLVCDVERFPDDKDEPMSAHGMGAVYTLTSTGRPLRADLAPAERDRITSMKQHSFEDFQSFIEIRRKCGSCGDRWRVKTIDVFAVRPAPAMASSALPHSYPKGTSLFCTSRMASQSPKRETM